MKTKVKIKIIILIVFAIVALAGIYIYARTKVAPPGEVKIVEQYTPVLESGVSNMASINDFGAMREAYIALNDKVSRYHAENVIDNAVTDRYRVKIDSIYGAALVYYGYNQFERSVWHYDSIVNVVKMLDELLAVELTNGNSATSDEFKMRARDIKGIVEVYHKAIRLTKNTRFTTVNDANDKIRQAHTYAAHPYLRYNVALINDLNAVTERLANSHYDYVNRLVNSLYNYTSMTKDDYMRSVERVEKAIKEYKNTSIYGSKKKSIYDLCNSLESHKKQADTYYNNQEIRG